MHAARQSRPRVYYLKLAQDDIYTDRHLQQWSQVTAVKVAPAHMSRRFAVTATVAATAIAYLELLHELA